MLKTKAKYIFWAIMYAVAQFVFTLYIFELVAQGNVLTATIWNMSIIMAFVIIDKLEMYAFSRLADKLHDRDKKRNVFLRVAFGYLVGPSAKSSLYFLYVVIIICSAIIAADAYMFEDIMVIQHPFSEYLQSMRYGLLLLVAADKFLDQIIRDIGTNKKMFKV